MSGERTRGRRRRRAPGEALTGAAYARQVREVAAWERRCREAVREPLPVLPARPGPVQRAPRPVVVLVGVMLLP